MKIAFTGASSTGKTTVAEKIIKKCRDIKIQYKIKFITINARSILKSMQISSLDDMTNIQKDQFQKIYLNEKLKKESLKDNYITDRSFVDLAAYWQEIGSGTFEIGESSIYLNTCKAKALMYDIHYYFPIDIINFSPDGYRSSDLNFNRKVDKNIQYFLDRWKINYFIMNEPSVNGRVDIILDKLFDLE